MKLKYSEMSQEQLNDLSHKRAKQLKILRCNIKNCKHGSDNNHIIIIGDGWTTH